MLSYAVLLYLATRSHSGHGLRAKNFQSLLNWDYTLQLLLAAGTVIESAHNMVAMAPFKEIILNGYSMKFLMVQANNTHKNAF